MACGGDAVWPTQRIYGFHRNTVLHIWNNKGTNVKREGNCGIQKKHSDESIVNAVRTAPVNDESRSTLRRLSTATGIPKGIIWRFMRKKKVLRKATSSAKPYLSPEATDKRLKFVLSFFSVSPSKLYFICSCERAK